MLATRTPVTQLGEITRCIVVFTEKRKNKFVLASFHGLPIAIISLKSLEVKIIRQSAVLVLDLQKT